MHLFVFLRIPLPETGQRTASEPHRRVRGSAAGGIREAGGRSASPRLQLCPAKGGAGPEIQRERFKDNGVLCNSETGPAEVWKSCALDESAKALLQAATQRLNLSARAFHRILKVSRTIADLDAARDIGVSHLAEALQYRSRGFVG